MKIKLEDAILTLSWSPGARHSAGFCDRCAIHSLIKYSVSYKDYQTKFRSYYSSYIYRGLRYLTNGLNKYGFVFNSNRYRKIKTNLHIKINLYDDLAVYLLVCCTKIA